MFSLFRGTTPPIQSHTGRSIASLETIRLGGLDQWVTLRGHDTHNPILLYVHGGPGMCDMGALRAFFPALEKQFTVVHWAQRGAGKSFSRQIPAASMTVEQFIDDLEELTRHLLKRFGQEKLVLVGQSWGTYLCMKVVQRAPELFHAYVGVNQIVDRGAEELRSYRAALELARQRRNAKAVAELEALGEPEGALFATIQGTYTHKGWVRNLGMLTAAPNMFFRFGKAIMLSPELTAYEVATLFQGLPWSMELLWPSFCRGNLFTEIPAVAVPVYFVAGQQDLVTDPELQAKYLEQLQAPHKEYVLFEQAGHLACYEEPERFLALMGRVREACGRSLASVI